MCNFSVDTVIEVTQVQLLQQRSSRYQYFLCESLQ